MFKEHLVSGLDASAVTLEARAGRLILTAGPTVLRQVPWLRGGAAVAVLVGWGREAGRLEVQRGGPFRALAVSRGRHTLDKLPPVTVRMDRLEHMAADAEHGPEPVAYEVRQNVLQVRLPGWAAPPVPLTAPPSPFASSGGLRDLSWGPIPAGVAS